MFLTLNEYVNQVTPQRNVTVKLYPDDYVIIDHIKEKGCPHIFVSVKGFEDIVYRCNYKESLYLYTIDEHGNKLKASCFRVEHISSDKLINTIKVK